MNRCERCHGYVEELMMYKKVSVCAGCYALMLLGDFVKQGSMTQRGKAIEAAIDRVADNLESGSKYWQYLGG